MRPTPKDRSLQPIPPAGADNDVHTLRDPGATRGAGSDPPVATVEYAVPRGGENEVAARRHRHATRQRGQTRPRQKARRLGPIEYTLLALIVLAIVVVIAMAIINPSG